MDEGQGRRDTQVSGCGGTRPDSGASCAGARGGPRHRLGAGGVRSRAGGGDVMVAEPVSHYGEYDERAYGERSYGARPYEERDGGFELHGEQREEPPPR